MSASQVHARNRHWLEAMAASPDSQTRLRWRNALVEQNLGLVKLVAQRHSLRSGQPFNELVSAGNMEAGAVERALQVRSLDAPLGSDDAGEPCCLLDQLAAQGPAGESTGELGDGSQDRCHWLRSQLDQLDGPERRLLEGRWLEGRSWRELGLELRLTSRQAQQRAEALLSWLQRAAGNPAANAMASRAAMAV
jgi:DNA-directed RNA polymerase sigma subunit (sigma70/sigma32)